ncbi:DUF1302 domain-containing protein [Solimonas sp. K1W22B-7]|uniref:DUF1302 domain-containing protein n=1 Tax=Solimonas sp. K1W22B-7 TaxID=2303331 RepID=UPI0013C538BF|nr:DUF1302 domain-containing protein [Solimonas sp. K1W22B-7]
MKAVHQRKHFLLHPIAIAAGLLAAQPAMAFEFDLGDTEIKLDNLISVGGVMRMQDRDNSLIGRSNLSPGLCSRLDPGTAYNDPDRRYSGDTCSSGEEDPVYGNRSNYFLAQPGASSPNGDNGNLNFDKHDWVHATAKMTTDLSFNVADFNFFARGLYFYDARYSDYDVQHPDTTAQPAETPFSDAGVDRIGHKFQMLDYFISRTFEIGERQAAFKIGNQVINWGESGFLALNSLNSINPPNQALLRLPGFDVKELFQPTGMAMLNVELTEGVNLETFYQYEWKPIRVDPVGSFFSSSDILGDGGTYAMLSFGKAPEDPEQLYEPWRNSGDPAAVTGSRSSRTVLRDFDEEKRRLPDDGGQYGAALRFFFDGLNNGTEVGLYYSNYHSRVPSVSALAANATCIPDLGALGNPATNLVALLAACQAPGDTVLVQNLATLLQHTLNPGSTAEFLPNEGREALPLDTMRLVVEYPENIRLWGVSFNTTLGSVAWSGEYAFRENLPVQIHTTDVIFAALQPAFPAQDFSLGIATLPGRRTAVPDFISQYRGITINPGDYVRGYERMKVGQLGTTFLKTIGGDNWVRASQITLLLELGMTHVLDMPELSELQFQGGGVDTHISSGADGSPGVNPIDVRSNPADPHSNSNTDDTLRQNPTAQGTGNYGTEYSYGYRLVTLTRFDDAFRNINLELLNAFFHDVEGTAPGLGQNFVEGRMQIISGLRFDYLATWNGEVRYTWFTGGEDRDALRDRDNIMLSLGYQF